MYVNKRAAAASPPNHSESHKARFGVVCPVSVQKLIEHIHRTDSVCGRAIKRARKLALFPLQARPRIGIVVLHVLPGLLPCPFCRLCRHGRALA